MTIDYFTLISGSDIFIDEVGFIKQPTLEDIKVVGFGEYGQYLNFLLTTEDDLKENSEDGIFSESLGDAFNHLIRYPSTRELLQKALSFFIRGDVGWSEKKQEFVVMAIERNNKIGVINASSMPKIRYAISKLCYLKANEEPDPKFKDKRARDTYEKLIKGRRAKAKTEKSDENMALENIISCVAAKSESYNLLNIWGLTRFQLYDQFVRIYSGYQLGVISRRWATWGKEDFDFSAFFKALN